VGWIRRWEHPVVLFMHRTPRSGVLLLSVNISCSRGQDVLEDIPPGLEVVLLVRPPPPPTATPLI
jgi:hypothetical protein